MAIPPKTFGRRNLPQKKIEPPPIVYHAPQGLGDDKESYEPRRLRSIAVIIGGWGLTTISGVAVLEAIRHSQCRRADPNNPDATADCRSGGGHGGGGGHYSFFGGSGSSEHSVAYSGFGATGESGAHGGGFGGFHGGGE